MAYITINILEVLMLKCYGTVGEVVISLESQLLVHNKFLTYI